MVKTYKQLYEVEAVVSKKTIKGQPLYLVKWKNYPSSENTWEPIEHLENVKWMVDEFNKTGDAPKPVIKPQLIDLSEEEILRPKRGRKPVAKKPKVSPKKPTPKPAAKQSRTRISSPERETKPKNVEVVQDILKSPTMKSIGIQTYLLPPAYLDTIKPIKRVSKSQETLVVGKRKTPRKH
jgi:hypothetical protein